ncbi:hypothetical protein F5146DRAFT_1006719 [Armillaria mellea]|nr:hypothetical protein F5146DRAFT_1006719 [Armillaria mellea]
MFSAIFKTFKLLTYLFVILGPAHYYLFYISKDPSLVVREVNFIAYAAMWAIALSKIDFHRHRFNGQIDAVVPALCWWVHDTITTTSLGIAIAILLHNLAHGTTALATQSPLLPGFFDVLSCTNHSCHIVGEGGPNGYSTISMILVDIAEHAREADQALNGLLLKIPLVVET